MNVTDYTGKPWILGRNGPEAFDCWGLTRVAAAGLFGLYFPDLLEGPERPRTARTEPPLSDMPAGWVLAATPHAGAVLALATYTGRVTHCALCLDTVRALTSTRALGSHTVPIATLSAMYPVARVYTWAP